MTAARCEPRYVLCPGPVTSRNDGQRHYVGAEALRRLYGVAARDCVTFPRGDLSTAALRW